MSSGHLQWDGTRAVLRPHTSRVGSCLSPHIEPPRSLQKGGLATLVASQAPCRVALMGTSGLSVVSLSCSSLFPRRATGRTPTDKKRTRAHTAVANGTPHRDRNRGTPTQRLPSYFAGRSQDLPDQGLKMSLGFSLQFCTSTLTKPLFAGRRATLRSVHGYHCPTSNRDR